MALGVGGIQTHIAGLSRGLTERGHTVNVVRTSTLTPVASTLRYVTRFVGRPDIIHVHGFSDMAPLAAGWIAGHALAGASVATAHGAGGSYWNKGHLNYVVRRELVRRFDTVISVSDYLGHRMTELIGGSLRIRTIYSGADMDLFQPGPDASEAKRRLGLDGKFVVLCVGRLSPEKGQATLLSSLPLVRREIPDTRVILCGKGSTLSRLESQSRQLGVEDMVEFRGNVWHDLLPPFYDAADVVVVPSNKEAFGIAILEAMSMNRPVVATAVGGIPEVVKHEETGVLVPPSDPLALSVALQKVHDDQGMAERLARNGRRLVEERFTWQRAARETEAAYVEALDR